MPSPYVLVLYYSRQGATAQLARQIARGIEESGIEAKLRTVPDNRDLESGNEAASDGTPFCSLKDLSECSGLALGSPTRFGQMAAPLHQFMEKTSSLWISGALIDKPASVFTSSSTLHGGQESTLLGMMLPLIHQGMIIMGIPFSAEALHSGKTGGTPYGASHVAGDDGNQSIDSDERSICRIQGKRLGALAQTLKTMPERL